MSTTPVTVNLTDEQVAKLRSNDWFEARAAKLLREALPDPTPERTEYRLTVRPSPASAVSVSCDEVLIHAGDLRNGDRIWVDGEWRAVSNMTVGHDLVEFYVEDVRRLVRLCSSLIVRPAGVS